jgi:NAD(P)H-hydrate repair Nnr-like enzyme with NAD(P)H-hydrate dehydratase domain
MITLHDFNHLPHEKALALIHPCVALPEWADALVRGRPYASRDELFSTANALTQNWDEAALAQALKDRVIAAAGLDVFEGEPSVHPDLLKVPNVVLTPHIASATEGTRRAMADLAVDNLVGYLVHGKAKTPLNPALTAAR